MIQVKLTSRKIWDLWMIYPAAAILIAALLLLPSGCSRKQKMVVQKTTQEEIVAQDTSTNIVAPIPPVVKQDSIQQEPQFPSGWVTKEWVNVRNKPTTQSEIITKLTRGTEVKLLTQAGDWWKVELEDSSTAFIHIDLISLERYVDPWTRFRMGCRLADTILQVIAGVEPYKDKTFPSAYVIVDDSWHAQPKETRIQIARAAYAYWRECLIEAGFKLRNSHIVLRDILGKDLAKATASRSGAASVKFLK